MASSNVSKSNSANLDAAPAWLQYVQHSARVKDEPQDNTSSPSGRKAILGRRHVATPPAVIPYVVIKSEVIKFRKTKQRADESVDEYVTRLRQAALACGWSESALQVELGLQVLLGVRDDEMRQK